MKVLLIHPPVRVDHDPVDVPAGLAILSSIAIQEGHQVALLDLNIDRPIMPWSKVMEQISVDKWDLIAIGGLSSMYNDIKKILQISRKLNPDALIVAGGGFITYMPDKIMQFNPEIDIAAIGEGEYTFREILQTFDSKDWKKIKGICFREDDHVVYTEPRPLIPDLDTIPYPAWDLLDMDEYFKYSGSLWFNGAWKSKRRVNFVTERGCPRQCTFCTHNGMNRWDQLALLGKDKVKLLDEEAGFQAITRFFSPEYVVDHALHLHEKYQIRQEDEYHWATKDESCNGCFAAGINFGASIVSLLYGEGDLKETIKIGSLAGWDSDTPTATWGGMLGFMLGKKEVEKIFGKPLSSRFDIHRTRKGFPNDGIDTFENMAQKGISIVDRVVVERMNGSIDSEKNRWVIPR